MSASLLITSRERPETLAAVLASVERQRVAPDEIIVADDGSGPATQAVIRDFLARSKVPARLVSQPHAGFRAARLRNLAIAAARHEYLVFIDGDMLLHAQFLADHLRCARRGWFTQGVRAHADAALSARLVRDPARYPSVATRGLGGLRRAYLLHAPPLARACRRVANAFVAVKACNLAAWRDDLLRVNGFDEEFVGWGPEDKELCARLVHAGVRRQTLCFGGIACHLHHPPVSRATLPANLARLAATRATRRIRAAHGLDGHR
ncbi:MAG TPA: glycosyltransferase [Steroidobacteraceae bacterium]|nr:glycosyltransferase [Steroidobacteraceae bacterium]